MVILLKYIFLGLGDTVKRDRPMIISKLSNIGAHKLSVQSYHSAILTLDGRAFLWGRNNHNQVTTDCEKDQSSPKLFSTNSEECIKDIACGAYNTTILSTNQQVEYFGKFASMVSNYAFIEYKLLRSNLQDINC